MSHDTSDSKQLYLVGSVPGTAKQAWWALRDAKFGRPQPTQATTPPTKTNPTLSASQIALISGLLQFADNDLGCYPSFNTLHATSGFGISTLRRASRALVMLKLLTITERGRGGNSYVINGAMLYRCAKRTKAKAQSLANYAKQVEADKLSAAKAAWAAANPSEVEEDVIPDRPPTDPIDRAADQAAIDSFDDPDDSDGPQPYRGQDGDVVDPSIIEDSAAEAQVTKPEAKQAVVVAEPTQVNTSDMGTDIDALRTMTSSEASRELAGLLLHQTGHEQVTEATLDIAAGVLFPLVKTRGYAHVLVVMQYGLGKRWWREVLTKSSKDLAHSPAASFVKNYDKILEQAIADRKQAATKAADSAAAVKARILRSNPGYNPDVDDPNTAMGRLVLSLL